LREQLALGRGPIFLVVGGVEARKNTNRILDAFVRVNAAIPDAQLVIAGGASILDHSAYRDQFNQRLVEAGVAAAAVHLTGPIADGNMPALYRLATALVFASVKEGFGLCVLEAMASGTPVIVSSTRPFTDYLAEHDAIWCDPLQAASIADAMVSSLQPRLRQRLVWQGHAVAARHDWQQVARLHLPFFHALLEPVHA
jgi:glycosyltransferase involved in cell wall biosynthesis